MEQTTLINIKNCRVQDTHGTALPDISWRMDSTQTWLVTGPNGSGKATFLKALAGEKQILPINQSGAYTTEFYGSTEIVSLEKAAALIQEERNLDETEYMDRIDEGRTGRRFICEVLGGPDAKHRAVPLPPIASRLETLPEVKLCGIEHILDRGLKYMSTGEIRRTLLCRALLSGKKLLILSDPFAGLDTQSRSILFAFFQTITRKRTSDAESFPHIILGMERYQEIPETITHVLEFFDSTISFCGTKQDYERLINERASAESAVYDAEKAQFIKEIKTIQSETTAIQDENSAEKALVQMNSVHVGWDGHAVLTDFSWSVFPGQHWLIRGPNGSGKTTLLELITGDNHQVFCNDIWIFGRKRGTGETIWDIKSKLGIVSYRWHVEYRMVGGTDLESVIISGFHDSIGLYEQKTDMEIAAAHKWLKLAGFEGREHECFSSLSYGEQRAVLIIRAAVKNPKILILDEPCHGLDDSYRKKILALLETVAETGTTTLLHVTHDPTEALPCEKHILELHPNETPMYKIIRQ